MRELWVIDAEWLTARVHCDPAPDGYRETFDFGPGDLLAPRFAPDVFALRPDELDLA